MVASHPQGGCAALAAMLVFAGCGELLFVGVLEDPA